VRRAGTAPAGICVVDERGAVLPAAREVLKVCAAQRLVVHTGHASAEQALALIAAAREEGCDRIVVTHAQFDVVGMTPAHMKKAAAMGAKMELARSASWWGRCGARVHAALAARTASCGGVHQSVGARHAVLGTDLGQRAIPPADGLQMFVAGSRPRASAGSRSDDGREVRGALLKWAVRQGR
jgi:hypothetical protein